MPSEVESMKDCTFAGMDKDTTQLELYKHFIGFFLSFVVVIGSLLVSSSMTSKGSDS